MLTKFSRYFLNEEIIKNCQMNSSSFAKKNSVYKIYTINNKKISHFFRSITSPLDVIPINKNIQKPEEWYTPKETLVFKNKKIELLKILEKDRKITSYLTWLVIFPSFTFSAYKFLKSVYFFSGWLGFWGPICYILYRVFLNSIVYQKHYLFQISLLDDGKTVEVQDGSGTNIIDINKIRKIQKEELLLFYIEYTSKQIPVIMNNKIYLIFQSSAILNQELFSAVMNGQYINVNDHKIDEKNSIDV